MLFGSSAQGKQAEAPPGDDYVRTTFRILEALTRGSPLSKVKIRLWNGIIWPENNPTPATLVLNSPSALRAILSARSEVALGEAYLDHTFDVEGNLEAAFEFGDIIATQTRGWTQNLSLGGLLLRLPCAKRGPDSAHGNQASLRGIKNSPRRDRDAVRFHYDRSNDFYALWLDPRMVYSCGYFESEETSLEEAQLRKLDLLCRKLDLRRGERLLDIGSGWGGLLIHAASQYGVRADGITLSQNQYEWTRELISRHGLQDQVTVRVADYRELKEAGSYDKIASVGMVEHVGRKMLPAYFSHVRTLLKSGGLFLNHGIGEGPIPRINQGETFIDRYVFPDSDLVTIGAMLQAAAEAEWDVRDVEGLRKHYALTLRHWVKRLEARREEALREIDEASYRVWRVYMAGSAHSFQLGYLSIYQTLLAKMDTRGDTDAPLTREKWYQPKN